MLEQRATVLPDVLGVEQVRARWSGHRIEADLTIQVDHRLTIDEGHAITERVEQALIASTRSLGAVVIHLHPAVLSGAEGIRDTVAPR